MCVWGGGCGGHLKVVLNVGCIWFTFCLLMLLNYTVLFYKLLCMRAHTYKQNSLLMKVLMSVFTKLVEVAMIQIKIDFH